MLASAVRNAPKTFLSTHVRRVAVQCSLDEEFPGVPFAYGGKLGPSETRGSTAPSGLKIASCNSNSQVATIAVVVNAGSRFETAENAGVSHLLEKMAFRSTEKRSDIRMYRDIEAIGGQIFSRSCREQMIISITVLPDDIERAAEILSESVRMPRFAKWDIETQKKLAQVDYELLYSSPQSIMHESLHAAAYCDNSPLGRSIYAPGNVGKLNSDILRSFHAERFAAPHMGIVGLGVDHATILNIAQTYFSKIPSSRAPTTNSSPYVGGERRVEAVAPVTHVAVGFKGAAWLDKDVAAMIVLSGALRSASASTSIMSDQGLFSLCGAAPSDNVPALIDSFVASITQVASKTLDAGALAHAKAFSKTQYALQNENRHFWGSCLGGMLLHDTVASEKQFYSLLDSVTAADVQNFARMMIECKPALASLGDLSNVPHVDQVASRLK